MCLQLSKVFRVSLWQLSTLVLHLLNTCTGRQTDRQDRQKACPLDDKSEGLFGWVALRSPLCYRYWGPWQGCRRLQGGDQLLSQHDCRSYRRVFEQDMKSSGSWLCTSEMTTRQYLCTMHKRCGTWLEDQHGWCCALEKLLRSWWLLLYGQLFFAPVAVKLGGPSVKYYGRACSVSATVQMTRQGKWFCVVEDVILLLTLCAPALRKYSFKRCMLIQCKKEEAHCIYFILDMSDCEGVTVAVVRSRRGWL